MELVEQGPEWTAFDCPFLTSQGVLGHPRLELSCEHDGMDSTPNLGADVA